MGNGAVLAKTLFRLLFAGHQKFNNIFTSLVTQHVVDRGQGLASGDRITLGTLDREDFQGIRGRLIGKIAGRILKTFEDTLHGHFQGLATFDRNFVIFLFHSHSPASKLLASLGSLT